MKFGSWLSIKCPQEGFCCSLTFCVCVCLPFFFDEGYFWKGLMEDGIVCVAETLCVPLIIYNVPLIVDYIYEVSEN